MKNINIIFLCIALVFVVTSTNQQSIAHSTGGYHKHSGLSSKQYNSMSARDRKFVRKKNKKGNDFSEYKRIMNKRSKDLKKTLKPKEYKEFEKYMPTINQRSYE